MGPWNWQDWGVSTDRKFWNQSSPELFQNHLEFFYFFNTITPHQFASIFWYYDGTQLQKQYYHPAGWLSNFLSASTRKWQLGDQSPYLFDSKNHANRWISPQTVKDKQNTPYPSTLRSKSTSLTKAWEVQESCCLRDGERWITEIKKHPPSPHPDSGERAYQKSFQTMENKTLLCVPQVWTKIRPWSRAKKSTEQNQPSRFPWPLFSRLIIGLNKVSCLDQRHWHLKCFLSLLSYAKFKNC